MKGVAHPKNLPACNLRLAPPGAGGLDVGEEGGVVRRRGSVEELVAESSVIVFGKRGCCMGHVIRRLLISLGVNPAVYEVEDGEEAEVSVRLSGIGGGGGAGVEFPAVCIGGRLFGGLDRVMSTHITGDLVPVLRQAKALWL